MRSRPPLLPSTAAVLLACAVASATATASAQAPAAIPAAVPAPPAVDVASYVVADNATGQILAERAPHLALPPASTLKVLTADTLIPRLSSRTTIDPQPSDYAAEPDGSLVGITTGVTYTVADLWHGVFLASGNDAIATLAHLAGGTDRTLALMRAKAAALGATDTVVVNADGYDADGQVSSAYDLALMARAGLQSSAFRSYCGLTSAWFPEPHGARTLLDSHDPMLLHYSGMIGIKGGITINAGHTYVGAATRNGRTLIVTVMHGGTDVWTQVTELLDWGFAADGNVTPVGKLGSPSQAPAKPSQTTAQPPTTTVATTAATTSPTATTATSQSPAQTTGGTSLPTQTSDSVTSESPSSTSSPSSTAGTTSVEAATAPVAAVLPHDNSILTWQRAVLAVLLLGLVPLGLRIRRREMTRRH